MSIYCVGLCLNCETGLTLTEKFILLAICEKADNDGGNAWPSVHTLARYAECSDRTVQRTLLTLRQRGWIEIVKRASRYTPRVYRVNLSKFQGCQPVTHEATRMAARDDRAMSPDPSITRPVPTVTEEPPPRANGNHMQTFIAWWHDTYSEKRRGTKYLMNHGRDISIIRRLVAAYGLERLKTMAELFLITDEPFIASTDRGIPLLAAKAMWLDHRLREHGR
jgi:hypothetical protein